MKKLGRPVIYTKEELIEKRKKYEQSRKPQRQIYAAERVRKIRLLIINHYTKNTLICQCKRCDVKGYDFLTIEHLNTDGAEQRREINPQQIYRFIIDNDFPDDYTVLCWNCNCSKKGKECAHFR